MKNCAKQTRKNPHYDNLSVDFIYLEESEFANYKFIKEMILMLKLLNIIKN